MTKNNKSQSSKKEMHTPVNNWFANAMKSVGLSGTEMIKKMTPAIYEFSASTSAMAKDAVNEIRTTRSDMSRITNAVSSNPYVKLTQDVFRNSLNDLKSGKFVNVDREKEYEDKMMEDMFGNIDDLFNGMDDESISFDDSDDDGSSDVNVTNNNIVTQQPSPDATLLLSRNINQQTKIQIDTSKATVDTMIAIASNNILNIKELGESITSRLDVVNENLSAIIEYNNENMTRYIDASIEYYKQTSPYGREENESTREERSLSDVLGSKNTLDPKRYLQAVLGNVQKTYKGSLLGFAGELLVEHPELIAASPLSFVTSSIIQSFVPKVLKSSLTKLDETFSSFFPTLLGKISDLSDSTNPILSTIGKIFGIKEERRENFKLDTFERGAIPFDGVTKHAVVEIIPTYLRKILSALTKEPEITFDWSKGRYTTVDKVRDNATNLVRDEVISKFNYSKVGDEMDKRKELLVDEDRSKFETLLENFYLALERSERHFDPFDNSNGDPFANVYKDIDRIYGKEMGDYLRASIRNMDKTAIMQLNAVRQEATRSRMDMMKFIEENPYDYNLYALADNIPNTSATVAGHNINTRSTDGKLTVTDYLRDIRFILNRGINVRFGGEGSYTSIISTSSTNATIFEDNLTGNTSNVENASVQLSQDDIEYLESQGKFTRSIIGSGKSQEELSDQMKEADRIENTDFLGNPIDHYEENGNSPFARVRRRLKGPATEVSKGVNRVNDFLYSLIFGSGEQAFEVLAQGIVDKVTNAASWLNEQFLKPFKDSVFGVRDANGFSQGGILSSTQNSMKDIFNSMKRELTGKGYTKSDGTTVDDKDDSETVIGNIKSVFNSIKENTATYLFGEKDPETGKRVGKGIIKSATQSIKDGFNNWAEVIFGKNSEINENSEEIKKAIIDDVKEKAPKSLAGGILGATAATLTGGKLGLIGSLFLPGGPVGGAIVGTAVGFASQSEKVQEILLGEKDEDGNRLGGIISKDVQEFFSKNKVDIIGGASLGALKSMILGNGLIPSLFLPGGPIGGAILGAGFGMIRRSKAVQEFLYGTGEEGEEGYKKGVINSIKEKFTSSDGKNKFGMAVSGAGIGFLSSSVIGQMGLVGAFLTPGGPIGGALIGAALGIASSSDKFRDFMFGEYDEEEGKRKGGLVGKMTDYLNIEVFQPMKLKISEVALDVNEFLVKSVLNPVQDAIAPFAYQLKLVGESIHNKFVEIRDKITETVSEHIIQPITENLNKYLFDPMKKFANTTFNLLFGAIKAIIASPFKLLSAMTQGLVGSHEDLSFNREREKIWSRDNSKGETGVKGLFNRFVGVGSNFVETVKLYGSPTRRAEARRQNVEYLNEGYKEEIAERNAKQDEKFSRRRAELNAKRDEYRNRQRTAREEGYGEDFSVNDAGSGILRNLFGWRKNKKNNANENETSTEEPTNTDATLATEEDVTTSDTQTSNRKEKRVKSAKRGKKQTTRNNETSTEEPTNTDATLATETEQATVVPDVQPERNTSNKEVKSSTSTDAKLASSSESDTLDDKGSAKKRRNVLGYLKDISGYTKAIKDEVKGQLNGVGINISKIRRILAKKLNVSEEDDAIGSDNNAELTFMDKVMYMLSNPLRSAAKLITSPFKLASTVIGAGVKKVQDAFDFITSIPQKIFNGITSVLNTLKDGVVGVVKGLAAVPKALFNGAVEITKGLFDIGKTAIQGAFSAIGSLANGVASLIGSAFSAVGSAINGVVTTIGATLAGIPDFVKGTAEAIGAIGSGIMSTIGAAGRATIGVLNSGISLVGDLAKKSVEIIGNVANTVADIVAAPFRLVSNVVGNIFGAITGKNKEVRSLKGGYIDRIALPVEVKNELKNGKRSPLHVIIDGTKSDLPVKINNEDKEGTSDDKKDIFGKIFDVLSDIFSIIDNKGNRDKKRRRKNNRRRSNTSFTSNDNNDNNSPNIDLNINPDDNPPPPELFIGDDNTPPPPPSGNGTPYSNRNSIFGKIKGGISDWWQKQQRLGIVAPGMAQFINMGTPEDGQSQNTGGKKGIKDTISSIYSKIFKKKQDEENEAKIEDGYKQASRKTAQYMIAERTKVSDKLLADAREEQKLNLLTEISSDTKEHKFNWLDIFGKKGLIGAALIAGIPLLLKFLKKINGFSLADTLKQIMSDIGFGFNASGGVGGIVENVKEEVQDVTELVTGNSEGDNILERLYKYIFPNDDGNPLTLDYDHETESKLNVMKTMYVQRPAKWIKYGKEFLEKHPTIAKGLGKVGQGVKNLGKGVVDGGKNIFSNIKNKIMPSDIPVNMADDVVDMGVSGSNMLLGTNTGTSLVPTNTVNMADDVVEGVTGKNKNVLSKLIDKVKPTASVEVFDESGNVIASVYEGKLGKIKGFCDDALSFLSSKIDDVIKKFTGKSGSGTISKLISKVTSILSPAALLSKMGKFGAAMAKVGAAAASLTASEYFWFGLGAVNGVFNAANLFQVDEEYVDAKMRAISAVFEGGLGTSWGSFIDIINEIAFEILGFSFVHEVAVLAYSIIATEEERNEFTDAKAQFQQEYVDYVENEYQTAYTEYLSQTPENEAMSYDEFRQSAEVDTMSYAEYNSQQHKTLGSRMMDAWNGAVEGGSNILGTVKDGLGAGINWVKEKGGSIKNKLGELKDNLLQGSVFDDDYVRQTFGLSEEADISLKNRASMGLSNLVSNLTFGKLNIDPKVFNGAMVVIQDAITKAPEAINNTLGKVLGFTDENGNPIPLTEGVKDTFVKAKDAISQGWSSIKTNVGNFVNTAKTEIVKNFDNFKKNMSNAINNTNQRLGSFFGFTDDEGNPISFTAGVSKSISTTIEQIKTGWGIVTSNVSSFVSNAKDTIVTNFDNFKQNVATGVNKVNNKLGAFFNFKDEEGNPISFTSGVEQKFDAVVEDISDKWTSITSNVASFVKDAKDTIETKFDTLKTNIAKGIEKVDQKIGAFLGLEDKDGKPLSLSEGVSYKISETTKGIRDTWTNIKQGFSSWYNNLSKALIEASDRDTARANAEAAGQGVGMGPSDGAGYGDNYTDIYNNFAHYSQGDSRWGSKKYGSSTIKASGCGPTSMAMVATSLTGNKYYPEEVANMSQKWGDVTSSSSTKWSLFSHAADYYGLDYSQPTVSKSSIKTSIDNNKPLILSGNYKGLVNKDDSPFTTAGHLVVAHGYTNDGKGIIINDPRGTSQSKVYDTDTVLKETKGMFAFKRNSKSAPTPLTGTAKFPIFGSDVPTSTSAYKSGTLISGDASKYYINPTNSTSTSSDTSSTLDRMTTFMSEFSNRAWEGVLTGNWNSDYSNLFTENSSTNATLASSSSNASLSASTLEDEILLKTIELTRKGEGDFTSVNPNDNGSYSVGIMQFHGGKAKEFFNRLASKLSGSDRNIALKYANMSSQALSNSQAREMRSFLTRVSSVSEQVQLEYAKELVGGNMSVAKDMYENGELHDPRSIILISDIANTGPAHIKTWRSNYDPLPSSTGELEHVRNSLKSSDSWWGRQTSSKYYKGWMNRIDNTYNELSSWTPSLSSGAGYGEGDNDYDAKVISIDKYLKQNNIDDGAGYGEGPSMQQIADTAMQVMPQDNIQRVSKDISYTNDTISKITSEISSRDVKPSDSTNNELLIEIIELLKAIASNTLSSSERLEALRKLQNIQNSNFISKMNNPSNTIIEYSPQKQQTTTVPMSRNEQLARRIASGR